MPWVRSKTHGENVKFLPGDTDEAVAEQFEEFLEGQRRQGRMVTESETFEGEWEVSDEGGFIDIYYVDW